VSALLHETVRSGLDHLDGKCLGQLGQRLKGPSVDAGRGLVVADLEANGADMSRSPSYLPIDSQVLPSSTNKPVTIARAKRSATPKHEDRFQERRLARSIAARHEAEPRWDLDLCLLDATEIPDAERQKVYGGLRCHGIDAMSMVTPLESA
jgi:hypothetical protein